MVPLPPCSSENGLRPPRSTIQVKKESVTIEVVIGFGMALFSIFILLCALYRIRNYRQKEEQEHKYIESLPTSGSSSSWKLASISEPLSISVAAFETPLQKLTFSHLLEATDGFSANSLIGSGGFGYVYKAQLGAGRVVSQGDREFMAKIETNTETWFPCLVIARLEKRGFWCMST